MDRSLPAEQRANLLVASLTQEEKLTLVTGYFGVQTDWNRVPVSGGATTIGGAGAWRTAPEAPAAVANGTPGSGVATQGEAPAALERT